VNKIKLLNRIKAIAERDLLAELAIELYDEGYREATFPLKINNDPHILSVFNAIREWEKFGKIIPMGLGKKLYIKPEEK